MSRILLVSLRGGAGHNRRIAGSEEDTGLVEADRIALGVADSTLGLAGVGAESIDLADRSLVEALYAWPVSFRSRQRASHTAREAHSEL